VGILARYRSPEALPEALQAAAERLAELVDGVVLLYRDGSRAARPDAWAGFESEAQATRAGTELQAFKARIEGAEGGLRVSPPDDPALLGRPVAGVCGLPLRLHGRSHGALLIGFPGSWPPSRAAEVESIVEELSLLLAHHGAGPASARATDGESPDPLLQLSEQLLAYEVELARTHEQIKRIESARDELVEKLSHELRIPVHGMIERVISVLTAEHDALSPASRQALRQALDDGATFLRTLQHMLDLWRLKQAPMPVECQEVNLYEIVEEAVFNVQDRLQPGVQIVRNVASKLPRVKTDLAKLNQILFLLLDNAVKFTSSGTIELELQLEDGQLLCSVSDTGVGIAPEDQKQIFEEFFQVDAPSDGRYRGAGLGLPLARALVSQLGGALSLTSEIGRGSRFSFTLPVKTL
jgi:signal transduction histidine kinase